jgi:uncharacterized protein YggU (UPF0235/DUF167 family)
LIFTVRVKFDSFDKFILDDVSNEIEISVSSSPIREKANREIIQKISKNLNVKKSDVIIIHGSHSKTKVIDIALKYACCATLLLLCVCGLCH